MYEKLIEHWLTNVNELGFQLPLCEALLAYGYTVLHVSKHGRGEHGKDIIARDPQGTLTTFQLKGGDIDLPTWRKIRGEIEELVQLPVMLPGIDRNEPHAPVLVTNGELRGDAVASIREYSEAWHMQGHGSLVVWQKPELLQKFVAAHGSYVTSASLTDFRSFVELYVSDFSERLPRRKFADFVFGMYPPDATLIQKRRALESAILMGDYVIAQYESAQNHISAIEGWTILAALVMYAAERDKLAPDSYEPSLNLISTGFDRAADRFLIEVVGSDNFVSPRLTIAEDPSIRGARTMLVLGWLSALWHRNRLRHGEDDSLRECRRIILRELPHIDFLTEADWPYFMSIILFLDREVAASTAELWLSKWIEIVLRSNGGGDGPGFPSPYWLQEKALAFRYGKLPPDDSESFRRHTYTVHSALDMFVRRLCRQTVRGYWKRVAKLTLCDLIPDQHCDWFRWRCEKGDCRMALFPLSTSWAKWRRDAGSVEGNLVPQILISNSDWLLPFALVFPHRVNRAMSGVIDAAVGGRATIV